MHIDVPSGKVVYNSAQNMRHSLNNVFSVGIFLSTAIYVGYLYKTF